MVGTWQWFIDGELACDLEVTANDEQYDVEVIEVHDPELESDITITYLLYDGQALAYGVNFEGATISITLDETEPGPNEFTGTINGQEWKWVRFGTGPADPTESSSALASVSAASVSEVSEVLTNALKLKTANGPLLNTAPATVGGKSSASQSSQLRSTAKQYLEERQYLESRLQPPSPRNNQRPQQSRTPTPCR